MPQQNEGRDGPSSPPSTSQTPPSDGGSAERDNPAEQESTHEDVAETAFAPSLPDMTLTTGDLPPRQSEGLPVVGQRIEDFQLVSELGRGAMGIVFLARQISLDRQVALKISANLGDEARTMANLEHRHIVQVFSETVLPEKNLRLLCMQYVAGGTLQTVIQQASRLGRPHLEGSRLLEIIDESSAAPALLDPDSLRDRDSLQNSDFVETACWMGSRLAEALDYAHGQGVLHRDIKPANILIDQYGHPRLADFSLSSRSVTHKEAGSELFGGTLYYMAPEHIDAFNPNERTGPEVVNERSDIYSLGIVVYEMLTFQVPNIQSLPDSPPHEVLDELARRRRTEPLSVRRADPDVPGALDRTLRQCCEGDPGHRFQTGRSLAQALEGCLQLRRMEKELPRPGWITRSALLRPILWATIMAVLPHVIGSAVNITYNTLQIVNRLTPGQHVTFHRLVLAYNAVIYPVCLWAMIQLAVVPVVRTWRALNQSAATTSSQIDAARRKVLTWPLWAAWLACVGWFPGAIYFPLGLYLFSGSMSWDIVRHFNVSVMVSGLIALTYSFVGVQYIALRVFYPFLWGHVENLRTTAQEELRATGKRLRVIQILAGLIPLSGAMLLVGVGPQEFSGSEYRAYKILVILLIGLGLAGFQLAMSANAILAQTAAALTGNTHEKT